MEETERKWKEGWIGESTEIGLKLLKWSSRAYSSVLKLSPPTKSFSSSEDMAENLKFKSWKLSWKRAEGTTTTEEPNNWAGLNFLKTGHIFTWFKNQNKSVDIEKSHSQCKVFNFIFSLTPYNHIYLLLIYLFLFLIHPKWYEYILYLHSFQKR